MKTVKRFLLLALIAVLGIFLFQNQTFLGEAGHIRFFKFELTLIVGFWLVISFLCGVILILVIDLPGSINLKLELRRKSQEVERLQGEIARFQPPGAGSGSSPRPEPGSPSHT